MQLRQLLLIALLFCFGTFSIAQAADKVHLIPDQFEQIELWKDYEYLIDSSTTLSLEEVRSSTSWQSASQIKNFGFTQIPVWARYTLKSDAKAPDAYVVPQTVTMDSIHFYVFAQDSLINATLCGDHLDYDTREVEYQACSFLLPKSSDPLTIYMRFQTSGPLTLPVTIREKTFFQRNIFYETYLYGLHFGLFLLVALYHLILFFFLKDRSLLLYSIYVFAAGVVGMAVNGILTQLFFRETGAPIDGVMIPLTGFSVFFYCLFILDFLSIRTRSTILHKVYLVMISLGVLLIISSFTVPLALTSGPAAMVSLMAHTLVLITAIYFFIKGYRDTGLLLIASSIFLVMAMLFALRVMGAIPVNFLTESGLEIGGALEVILISISLGSKFRRTAIEKQALASVGQFKQAMTGMVAHDLKNPLGVIMGSAPEKSLTRHMASHMLRLINNMLDVQKFETTEVKPRTKPIAVAELIKESIGQVATLAEEKNIQVKTDVHKGQVIEADDEMILRVLINLFTNAIKYSPNNGTVLVSAEHKGDQVAFSVTDQGRGIPKDQLESIFGAYHQFDPRNSGLTGSTGLGLTFCKLALQAHGSDVGVSSEVGKGTTFSFALKGQKDLEGVAVNEAEKAIVLSDRDKKLLLPLLPELRAFKLHQAVKMAAFLDQVRDQSLVLEHWANAVLNAAHNGNTEHFKDLLEQVDG